MSSAVTPSLEVRRRELLDRVESIVPFLRENAAQADKDRRLPQSSVEAMADAGVLGLWAPERFGGFEGDMTTQLEVVTALARGCSSASWLTPIFTGSNFQISRMSDEVQEEVWSDGTNVACCGFLTPGQKAEKVPGGWRVSGKWPWASGCYHAKWTLLAADLVDGRSDFPGFGFLLVPMSELTIKDTWFTLGMRGTGSNTVFGDDVFVPEHRVIDMMKAQPTLDLHQVPDSVFQSLWFAGTPIGIAQAALETAMGSLRKRSIQYTNYFKQIECPTTQLDFAEAASKIDIADLLTHRAAADADRCVHEGAELNGAQRARAKHDCGVGVTNLRAAMDLIVSQAGASAMADFNPLQRLYRDLSTCTLHAMMRPSIAAEVRGRMMLGLMPTNVPFI
jgi:alkylation response protein AidB-like acyl-CoA dehydrogenase